MSKNIFFWQISTLDFFIDCSEIIFIGRLDIFSHQTQGKTIIYRLVVVVFMDIIPKNITCSRMAFLCLTIFLVGNQGGPSQSNLDCIGICLIEIWQVGTSFVIRAVGFIDKVDILTIEIIARAIGQVWIIFELLYIDNSDIITILLLVEFSRIVDALNF